MYGLQAGNELVVTVSGNSTYIIYVYVQQFENVNIL